MEATQATTAAKYVRLSNTGGDGYFGPESSVGGGFFTGSTAYDWCVWTTGRLFLRGATGVAINGAATMSSTLTVTSDVMSSGGNVGSAAYFKHSANDTGSVEMTGSNATSGTFAGITVYGKSHASQANRIFYDSAKHSFRSADGGTDYLIIDGTTVTAAIPIVAPTATTSIPSIRLPHGAAPTSPTNGDMWTTTAGLYVRINGATVGPLT
jgi:hypothetical protein